VLAVHDKLTEYVGAAVPVPVTGAVVVEGCALLAKVTVALAAPVAVGVNVTVNGMLFPAAIVAGRVSSLMVNSEVFEFAAETVTLAPLAVNVPVAVPLVPTTTLPTAIVVGLTLSCPGEVVMSVPVPMSVTLGSEFEPVVILIVALNDPAALGANSMLIVVLCPAATVTGRLGETREKYFVEIAALLMVMAEELELAAVSDKVFVLPTFTEPKLRLDTLRDKSFAC